MTALLLLYLVTGLLVLGAGRALGRSTYIVAAVPPAATLVWLLARRDDIAAGIDESVNWIPALGVELDLLVDGFAALMLLLVAGVGVLVVAYSARYFDQPPTRLMGLLVLFGGAMTGLVMSDDLLVLYGFWELTSVTSFLLIGDRCADRRARAAALQALLITGAGSLAMLAGFIVLGQAAGTYELSAILNNPPSGTAVTVALVLILLGAFTKSAQYPFHSWLPAAMVAPTPVSAYLHSATMVKAGVYLVARMAPAFATVAMWRPVVATFGIATMLLAGLRALRQTDLKLLLALGTVSQLGFMMAVLGWGSPDALVAGSVLLLAHAAFKAAAFMSVGILDHQQGTRDLRRLPRTAPGWTPAVVVTLVAAASMAGIPLTFGFIAKEEAFGALTGAALAGVAVGSILTAAYSYRFAAGALGWLATEPPSAASTVRAPAATFVAPAAVLATVTVVLGCFPGLVDGLIDVSAASLTTLTEPVHLAVWHGVNLPLVLSLVALIGGAIIYAAGPAVARLLRMGATAPSAADGYRETLRGVNALANRVTAIAQPGSLPLYLGIILFTAMVVPGVLLLNGDWWTGWPQAVEIPVHVVLSGLLIAERAGGGDRAPPLRRCPPPRPGRLRDGGPVRGPGCTRPRADPSCHRDADDSALRPRPAPTARQVRTESCRPPSPAIRRRQHGCRRRVRIDAGRGSDRPTDHRLPGDDRGRRPGSRRCQRRQRHPRRLPRPRHARRDHGAHRRRHRHRRARPRRAAADPRRSARRRCTTASAIDPVGDPRCLRAHRVRRGDGRLHLVAVRRAQPARRRVRRRHRGRRGDRPALRAGRVACRASALARPSLDDPRCRPADLLRHVGGAAVPRPGHCSRAEP